MATVNYKVGMLVDHPNRPAWGPGKVVHVDATRVHVFFRDALERKAKVIAYTLVPLRVAASQSEPVLDELPDPTKQDGLWLLPANFHAGVQGEAQPSAAKKTRTKKPKARIAAAAEAEPASAAI